MKIIKKQQKHLTRDERKKKRTQIILVILVVFICIVLAYQAITDFNNNEWPVGLNYLQQPVGPGLIFIVLVTIIICGIIWLWQKIFGKKEQEPKKKQKHKSSDFKYPHERIKF